MNRRELDSFNSMLDKFNSMGLDENASLGMAGIMAQQRKAMEENTVAINRMVDSETSYNRGSSSIVRPPAYDDSIDFESFADQLEMRTFTVRVDNAFATIVDPLYRRMSLLAVDDRIFHNRLHNISTNLQRQTIGAINRMREDNGKTLMSLYMQYKDFMRFPVWNTLRLIGNTLMNTMSGILFGFKKRQSETDRIVEAINKQTEFLRLGSIDNTSGFFTRLMRQGLVGMPMRAISEAALESVTGISRGRAQDRENNRANGVEDNSWSSRMSSLLFNKSILLRGTQQGANGGMETAATPEMKLSQEILEQIKYINRYTRSLTDVVSVQFKDMATNVNPLLVQFAEAQEMAKAVSSQAVNTSEMAKSSIVNLEQVRNTAKATQEQASAITKMAAGSDVVSIQESRHRSGVVEHQKQELEFWERTEAANDDALKVEKQQLKWLQRIRDGQIWQTIISGAKAVLGGILSVLGTISSGIMGIAGTVAAMLKFSRLRGGLPDANGDVDGPDKKNKKNKKPPKPGKGGFFKRMLDGAKNFLGSEKGKNIVSKAKVGAKWGGVTTAALTAEQLGRYVAPARSFGEVGATEPVIKAPTHASGAADALSVPEDKFTQRVDRSNSTFGSIVNTIGDKLDEFFDKDFKNFFSGQSLADTSSQAASTIKAKADETVPKLQEISGRVSEAARKQMDQTNKLNEQSQEVLKSIDDSLKRITKNTDKKDEDMMGGLMNAFGGFSPGGIFGD